MPLLRVIILFVVAAIAEIGGAWLIWQAARESRGWWFELRDGSPRDSGRAAAPWST